MSARIVVSNWKYFHLYNVREHQEILANQGGRGRFSFTNFVSSTNKMVSWFYDKVHRMGNRLGLGTKSVCGFFTRKSKMTSKMAAKTSIFLIIQIKQLN